VPTGVAGVFSFCMCPGGFIVPAATEPGGAGRERHEPVAARLAVRQLGLVVAIELADVAALGLTGPMAGVAGEGAGYAGGIVSAALDGVRVARAIVDAR
jgi:uncharacterized FAD-dependent dehydrogenase